MPLRGPTGKRLSGAQQRQAARPMALADDGAPAVVEAIAALLDALGAAPRNAALGGDWLLRAQIGLADVVLRHGVSPRCDQASRLYDRASKCLDSAKLRVELDELISTLNQGTPNAAHVDSGEAGASAPTPRH